MQSHLDEQESFWAGSFGDHYIERNRVESLLPSRIAFFAGILRYIRPITSVLEFGANTGVNLKAIYSLIPNVKLDAVEINSCAAEALVGWGGCRHVYNDSLFAFKTNESYDLAFTSAVLIHINPDRLGECYRQLYSYTRRFILINEYYNPVPVEVPYRGHQGKLFKRDFAGEIMELFPQLQLRAYGFSYAKDPVFPGDDNTWFLLEKTT